MKRLKKPSKKDRSKLNELLQMFKVKINSSKNLHKET